MQFITNGPDIPDALVDAHETGQVVFFCGAGISYPAGLPGFKELVDQVYELSGTTLNSLEQENFRSNRFDTVLDLLERRLPGGRLALRRTLAKALKPKLRRKGATETHEALLQLARNRDGALRLVTTNFDRIFHVAAKRIGQPFDGYAAPLLPIPKSSRWNGLVHLHGLLPEQPDDTALNRLVVTSGDFGLAYLIERWAARFVSELFRNYTVCFVGYSINDPVLRYMMDALAADRLQGESTPHAWALGDCVAEEEEQAEREWKAKGVTPILYNVPAGTHDHSALHQTLASWARTYRDGVEGKEAIVVQHALAKPQESSNQDNFVGRVMWALSDSTGLPAKRFADFNPAPTLDWLLDVFSDDRFGHQELARFGVPPHEKLDEKLRFSFIRRPAPYDLAPRMSLSPYGLEASQWDHVMDHIARWLMRHLNDARLLIWLAERGGNLHDNLVRRIDNQLDHLAKLEADGNTAELERIEEESPNAIPGTAMRRLWSLLLTGRIKAQWPSVDLFHWQSRLQRDGLTTTLRLQLRELLSPKITIRRPFRLSEDTSTGSDPARVRQLVDWELSLSAAHVKSSLLDRDSGEWKLARPDLLAEYQQLLLDALDLSRELGDADDRRDRSHWDLPSISPHWQNRGFRDWVALIELLRDSWLATLNADGERATQIAKSWFGFPYPTFKRLALFAASHDDAITPAIWTQWLLADEAWWLWAPDTKRETFRLFASRAQSLTGAAKERLENAILAGPPRAMYRDDIEPEDFQDLSAHSIWLCLAKLVAAGATLGDAATERLQELSTAHPNWRIAANERDEFSHWMSGTGDPDFDDQREIELAPRTWRELVRWLMKPKPQNKPFYEDTWREVCRTRFFHSSYALRKLADEGEWPIDRWREALQTWRDQDLAARSWRYAAPLVNRMPNEALNELVHAVSGWLQAASKSAAHHHEIMLTLCQRIMELPLEAGTGMLRNGEPLDEPVMEAINHPIGHVAQALIDLWFHREPSDGDGLPEPINSLFSKLCDVNVERFRHGRVLLGSRLIALFRIDRAWTERHLLPLLSWECPVEAKAVWEGFLWSPRIYPPLLTAFKADFLECANYYAELGEHRQQFAAFLTYTALFSIDNYSTDDFRAAIGTLPQDGLEECAQALSQALQGTAEDQRADYWKNRVFPLWQEAWPKERDRATPRMAASLARLAIAAQDEFPSACTAIRDWLRPIEHPDFIAHLLKESDLCSHFPVEALTLLAAIVVDPPWVPRELGECLNQISSADASLMQDVEYRRLRGYVR